MLTTIFILLLLGFYWSSHEHRVLEEKIIELQLELEEKFPTPEKLY